MKMDTVVDSLMEGVNVVEILGKEALYSANIDPDSSFLRVDWQAVLVSVDVDRLLQLLKLPML